MPWPLLIGAGIAVVAVSSANYRRRIGDTAAAFHEHFSEVLSIPSPPLLFDDSIPNGQSNGFEIRISKAWLARALAPLRRWDDCWMAAIAFLTAHELAHHAGGHSWQRWVLPIEKEREADFVAGQLLWRAGFDREVLACALRLLEPGCSHSHGCWSDRLRRVLTGWDCAAG